MTTTRVLLRLDHTLTTLNALEEAVAAAEGLESLNRALGCSHC